MALESGDDRLRLPIVNAGDLDAIAVEREHRLQGADRRALLRRAIERAADDWRGRRPVADAGRRQMPPREFLAGIALARRGDVGMGEDALGPDSPPRCDVAAERGDGVDLAGRKSRQAAVMAGIDDFDADRGRIHVGLAAPGGDAGMPGALVLRDELRDVAAFPDKVMRGDFGGGCRPTGLPDL